MALSLDNMYLSLRNGQKMICESINEQCVIKAKLVTGQVQSKQFGVEYKDGEDVKFINEQPSLAPRMRRMLDDASKTVFKGVPIHYDVTNDIVTVDRLELEPMSVSTDGEPKTRVKLNGAKDQHEASAATKAIVRALAERQVKGEDILRDLRLNYGLKGSLKLINSGLGRWILLGGEGNNLNLWLLVSCIERSGRK